MFKTLTCLLMTLATTAIYADDNIQPVCLYWFDDNQDGAVEVEMKGNATETLEFTADASALTEGLHTLYILTRDGEGVWSFPSTWIFYKTAMEMKATGIKSYTYWWNDRIDMAESEEVGEVKNTFVLEKQLTVPQYARTGFDGKPLHARLSFVFYDDTGIASPLTFGYVKFPDANAPASQIEADKKTAYTSVNISWSGEDEELKDFNVYVSENGLPYVLWLPNTTATTAEFKGEPGKTYRFTVTARDKSDNVERFNGEKCATVRFNK